MLTVIYGVHDLVYLPTHRLCIHPKRSRRHEARRMSREAPKKRHDARHAQYDLLRDPYEVQATNTAQYTPGYVWVPEALCDMGIVRSTKFYLHTPYLQSILRISLLKPRRAHAPKP